MLRRLRADPSTAAIPCIALSANAMPEDIERGLAAGFADYWTKPIDFAVFIAALEHAVPASEAPSAESLAASSGWPSRDRLDQAALRAASARVARRGRGTRGTRRPARSSCRDE